MENKSKTIKKMVIRNGNPLQYSGLENSTDRGAYSPWGHTELDTSEPLTDTLTQHCKLTILQLKW